MDAQGLGRTHPLTPTRRLKQHTHAYNPQMIADRVLVEKIDPRRWVIGVDVLLKFRFSVVMVG